MRESPRQPQNIRHKLQSTLRHAIITRELTELSHDWLHLSYAKTPSHPHSTKATVNLNSSNHAIPSWVRNHTARSQMPHALWHNSITKKEKKTPWELFFIIFDRFAPYQSPERKTFCRNCLWSSWSCFYFRTTFCFCSDFVSDGTDTWMIFRGGNGVPLSQSQRPTSWRI